VPVGLLLLGEQPVRRPLGSACVAGRQEAGRLLVPVTCPDGVVATLRATVSSVSNCVNVVPSVTANCSSRTFGVFPLG